MAEEGYIRQESVEQTLANITLFRELEPAVKDADFVIEAIPERLELKKEAVCPVGPAGARPTRYSPAIPPACHWAR